MLYSLAIDIHDEKISISSVDGQILKDFLPMVAIDKDEKIIELGETAESLQEKSPIFWEQIQSGAQFCNPFSLSDFRPKLAGISVNYWAYIASHASLESQNKFFQDSTELQITIADYEKIDRKVQDLFEYYIQKPWRVKVKTLVINNQPKVINNFRWAEWVLRIGFPVVFLLLCFLVFKVAQIILGSQWSAPIPQSGIFASFIGVIVVMMFVIYGSTVFAVKSE